MTFDDFIQKVKTKGGEAFTTAKDTGKRLATINDLKSKIRGYKNDKNKLFTQMGMDLYIAKKQGDDIEKNIEEFVSRIDDINSKIKELQVKLDLIESEGVTNDTTGEDEFDDDIKETE